MLFFCFHYMKYKQYKIDWVDYLMLSSIRLWRDLNPLSINTDYARNIGK